LLRVCCDTLLERGAEQAGKGTVGDKSPNENGVEAVTWLSAIYPDARLIYIVRDGRDTVLSKRIQAFIDQPESLDRADRRVRRAFIQDPAPFLDRKRSIFTARWLESAAAGWAESARQSAAAGKRLFGDRFTVVRYEDLLAHPYPVMRGLWSFLEVGGGPAELEAAIAGQIRQNPEADWHQTSGFAFVRALPRGTHGGWQSLFTQADVDLFERRAGDALKGFGYFGPS
jgi:hypothetical protein